MLLSVPLLLFGARRVLLLCALVLAGCSSTCSADVPPSSSSSPIRTPTYTFEVVRSYPHDTAAFTQGLLWHDNRLFESTGQVGMSGIREVNLQTGRVLRERNLPAPHFGEGIVVFGEDIYQLTWETGRAYVYDWRTFRLKHEFGYDGEGWGLTSDGASLIMSDGTSIIRFRDPFTFVEQKSIRVEEQGVPVAHLNELEWVKGEIWANIWQFDQIARIDPTNGKVLGWIDLKGILPDSDRSGRESVLNGIAYNAHNDRIFVTGKNWSRLFEIRIRKR